MLDEKARLKINSHFSNSDRKVFCLTDLSEADKGALMSRYSRSTKKMRNIFLDEFADNPDRGSEFYEKILSDYGDDSIAQLGGAHIALEEISNIASVFIEDSRIGFGFLEKSSRYVDFGKKIDGNYQYYRPFSWMDSEFADDYIKACDLAFDTYTKLNEPLTKFLKEKFPIESFGDDINSRAYERSLKSKVLDNLRGLLPSSTLTNLGIFGDGQAFEYLLMKMYASDIYEVNDLAIQLHQELDKVIPAFIKRANNERGKEHQQWTRKRKKIDQFFLNTFDKFSDNLSINETKLVNYSNPLYMQEIADFYKTYDKKINIPRVHRRQKLPRLFEMLHFTFIINSTFGEFRDLHRHRLMTFIDGIYDTSKYHIPSIVIEAGLKDDYESVFHNTRTVIDKIYKSGKSQNLELEYINNFNFSYSYLIEVNYRQLDFMLSLRTLPQGHENYRQICQNMYKEVQRVNSDLSKIMQFVDLNEYPIERLKSEMASELKKEKYTKDTTTNASTTASST